MIRAESVLEELIARGFGLATGVPCSAQKSLINGAIDAGEVRWVPATNEGDAVAVAAGSGLGGVRGVVLLQNSGLGNAVNPLSSLTAVFRIPVLLVVTWRGEPDGPPDEPQHRLMGRVTPDLLELLEIPWELLPDDERALGSAMERASAHLSERATPYAFVVRKGTLAPRELEGLAPPTPPSPFSGGPDDAPPCDPDAVLSAVRGATGDDVVIATTGYTGRALYALGDRPNHLYMVGSMGCASSLGLGLALARPERRVVVLDGDGALMMRMGAMAAVGGERPPNLVHLLLDNGVHDSTGGQSTGSEGIDFAALARACGYPRASTPRDPAAVASALASDPGELAFLRIRTRPREDRNLPRPTVTPPEVAERLRRWVAAPPDAERGVA